jgi:hypothetical protein
MLEVGVTNTQSAEPPLVCFDAKSPPRTKATPPKKTNPSTPTKQSFTEARSHFGAWAITSSPLIIGMNVSDDPTVDAFWTILSNTEAITINQDYAGESGTLFWESDELTFFTPCGWWLQNCTYASQMYWSKRLSNGDVAVLM